MSQCRLPLSENRLSIGRSSGLPTPGHLGPDSAALSGKKGDQRLDRLLKIIDRMRGNSGAVAAQVQTGYQWIQGVEKILAEYPHARAGESCPSHATLVAKCFSVLRTKDFKALPIFEGILEKSF